MALIVPVRGFTPQIGKDCFLAENATIVGDTVIGDGCSIWFNAVLRGDVNWIKIGNHVNIQDGSVLHTLYEKSTITIGDYVSVGHNVTIHGADVHDYALIGMGSTLLDGVVVGEGAIVAAGSLVLKNTQIGPYEVWGGVPATDEFNDHCPECGGENIQQLRRVTGYLTGNYKTAFNAGKVAEVEDRVKHTGVSIV